MIHSLSSPGPATQWAVVPVWSTNLVPATQLKHWMNLCLFTCVSYLPEYLIAGHVARNHNYLVLTCAACRVAGPVDDKFICLIPTSHAIQHQRRPQTFALLTRRASSNLVIFFLYSVQEIIFSCSFTYIIGGPRVPCENANISPKSIQKWSFGTVKYFVSENGNCYCQHLCNKSMSGGVWWSGWVVGCWQSIRKWRIETMGWGDIPGI